MTNTLILLASAGGGTVMGGSGKTSKDIFKGSQANFIKLIKGRQSFVGGNSRSMKAFLNGKLRNGSRGEKIKARNWLRFLPVQ
jgi:hypothetical protein